MNNLKRFLSVFALIIGGTSCSEKINEEFENIGRSITVRSEVVSLVKAGYDGTTVLPDEFVMDIIQGSNKLYNYSLVNMIKESETNIYNAPEDVRLIWAEDDHSNVTVKAMTIPYGLTEINGHEPMEVSVSPDQDTERKVEESDLLVAESGNGVTIDGDDIKIVFSHLLTKLQVEYRFENELANSLVTVNSIVLENTCIKGGYSYAEMDFDTSVSLQYGDIKMYIDPAENTAECIFYPYIPEKDAILNINTTINGTEKVFSCPVSLKDNGGFKSGTRYKMRLTFSGSDAVDASITSVKSWNTDDNSILTDDCEKVLWIGTSIPAGNGDNNYPKMVADALGFKLYNNARGSSFVCFYSPGEDGTSSWAGASDWTDYESQVWKGYSLSATIEEVEAKFGPEGLNVPDWLLNSYKQHSFENLIIPYIDGTIASCNTIVFDHGYNDRATIINECSWHKLTDAEGNATERAPGYSWLMELADNSNNTSELYLQGCWHDDNNTARKNSYLYAMSYLIKRCLEVNPKIKIVIGNYFAWKTPVFAWENNGNDNTCNLLCGANEALGGMWMRHVVNVYKYTGIRNMNINGVCDYNVFCPDGVHPHSDTTGESNRIIAGAYINELNGIIN